MEYFIFKSWSGHKAFRQFLRRWLDFFSFFVEEEWKTKHKLHFYTLKLPFHTEQIYLMMHTVEKKYQLIT